MKQKTKLYMPIIAVFLLFAMGGCKDETNEDELANFEYTEYSLPTSCKWAEFTQDKVVIINNAKDLGKYVECTESIPNIDFSRQILIIAGGETNAGIHNVESEILKEYKNKLVLKANVHLLITGEIDHW